MRTSILSLVCGLCLLGCSPDAGPSGQKTASVNDTASTGSTGAGEDTAGDPAGDTGDTGDTGEPEVPLDADFVMDSVRLLPSSQGFDLNGDGEPDNALSLLFENELIGDALGGSPNGYIADSVARGELLVMLDFSNLGSFIDDRQAGIDMLLGASESGSERFDGDATFQVRCGSLAEDGSAASTFDNVQVASGALSGAPGEFLFLMPFAIDTTVLLRQSRIEGTMEPDGTGIRSGTLGGSITFGDLREVVRNDPEIGPEFARIMLSILEAMLDVDQDGDGEADALSAMFQFTAVSGTIDREAPCVTD